MITGRIKDRMIFINGQYLSPKASQKAYNHSPDGFAWGTLGSGSAQLALALLIVFTDKEISLKWHQVFKRDLISQLPREKDFDLTEDEIFNWMHNHGIKEKRNAV